MTTSAKAAAGGATRTQRLCLALIRAYQRWLSPYKGFRCAHAALHGGVSCSQAVASIVAEDGLWQGRPRIRARFAACRAAHAAYAATPQHRRSPGTAGNTRGARCARRCGDGCDCADTCDCLASLPCRHCDDGPCDCF